MFKKYLKIKVQNSETHVHMPVKIRWWEKPGANLLVEKGEAYWFDKSLSILIVKIPRDELND